MQFANLFKEVRSMGTSRVLSTLQGLIYISLVNPKVLQDNNPHSQIGKLRQGQRQLTATLQGGEHKEGMQGTATLILLLGFMIAKIGNPNLSH